jgi:hypothetical protein
LRLVRKAQLRETVSQILARLQRQSALEIRWLVLGSIVGKAEIWPRTYFTRACSRVCAVDVSEKAQLLELIGRSYAEFGQVLAAAEQKAVDEIASAEPLARAWLIRNQSEPIGYCIVSLVFSVRQRGRGAVLDQIYITPELRTRQMLRTVLEFIEYQAAQVGAITLDIKFAFKDKPKSITFKQIGFENGYSFMSKQLEPWPTYYRRSRE